MTTSTTMARTTISVLGMQLPRRSLVRRVRSGSPAHPQGQAVDFDDLGFVARCDRGVAGVARVPAGAAVVDAARFTGGERGRQADAFAGGHPLVDAATGPSQHRVQTPPESQ